MTPREASKLRILDPACGSGSFLIGAYQYLLDWHLNWYVNDDPKKWSTGRNVRIRPADPATTAARLLPGTGPGAALQALNPEPRTLNPQHWALTIKERKRILLDNIYGVDIDYQAVEVTKLSLLLKCLEGETAESLDALRLFRERALPDLAQNIQCGNSLIATDIMATDAWHRMTDDEKRRINPFDFERAFPDVFKGRNGGFDTVIGNPPYIRIQRIGHEQADYLFERYNTPASKTDLSQLFIERALELVTPDGSVGFICTSQWLATEYGRLMREHLAKGLLHELVDFGSLPVFRANTYPAIFILGRTPRDSFRYKRIVDETMLNLPSVEGATTRIISFSALGPSPWNLSGFDLLAHLHTREISWQPLSSFAHAYIGTLTGMDEAFVVSRQQAHEFNLEDGILLPYAYRGEEVARFSTTIPNSLVIYPYREGDNGEPILLKEAELRQGYPHIYGHLSRFKAKLTKRMDSRRYYATGSQWFRHLRAGSFKYIKPEKLLVKGIDRQAVVGLLSARTVFNGANCPGVIVDEGASIDLRYLLGIMNSALISAHLRATCPPKLSGYIRFNATNINAVPIRRINFDDPADRQKHDRIVSLVDQMLRLHRQEQAATTPHEKQRLRREIDATDRQIDRLVHEVYGLSDEEIRIVEEAADARMA